MLACWRVVVCATLLPGRGRERRGVLRLMLPRRGRERRGMLGRTVRWRVVLLLLLAMLAMLSGRRRRAIGWGCWVRGLVRHGGACPLYPPDWLPELEYPKPWP